MGKTESRQVRRAQERAMAKWAGYSTAVRHAQKGGRSTQLIHRNRRHRGDELDYFNAR